MEAIEEVNADAKDPSTYVNHKAEEFCKAVAGIPTRLGEAILASHKRWGYWRISATARPSRIDASGSVFTAIDVVPHIEASEAHQRF
jgi:hypothetical protein